MLLGEERANVYVYRINGQLIQELKDVTGRVALPEGPGIIKVVVKDRVISFKKI